MMKRSIVLTRSDSLMFSDPDNSDGIRYTEPIQAASIGQAIWTPISGQGFVDNGNTNRLHHQLTSYW
jgi:hypothetical protein